MRSNVVLTDFKPATSWPFLDGLTRISMLNWVTKSCINNQLQRNKWTELMRYAKYFCFSFIIFLNRNKYNYIIAWQQFYGIIFAYYCCLFRVKKENKLIISTFIYKHKQGVIGDIYQKFIKKIVTSQYIDRIVCHSIVEVDYYSALFGVRKDKFTFCLLGLDDDNEELKITDEGYFLSAGRANRDYGLLMEVFRDTEYKLRIICDKWKVRSEENMDIYNNIEGYEYLKMMSRCHAVVIALDDPNISSGQLVLIQAMQYAKPIIITHSNAILEYVINGTNGFIVPVKKEAILEAIKKLDDRDTYEFMSREGQKRYHMYHTLEAFGESYGNVVLSIQEKNKPLPERETREAVTL